MTKYLFKRLLHGLFSVVIVVAIVMLLIYSLMNRDLIFAKDTMYTKKQANQLVTYKYEKWEVYGYLDYVTYGEYLAELANAGEIDEETRSAAVAIGSTESKDKDIVREYVAKFKEEYESRGYTITRLDYDTRTKQKQVLFASKDIPVYNRLINYFLNLFEVDNIHYVEDTTGEALENTGISFTFFDPLYNSDPDHKVFSPAIIGNGTQHKYLLYFDGEFPYIHQNLLSIHLGVSYSVTKGTDIFHTLTDRQDPNKNVTVSFPTGLTEESPYNMHTATYVKGTQNSLKVNSDRFVDDYTSVIYFKQNMSKTGFSFVIGLISVVASYLIGVPLGILMARKKDTWIDQLGSIYVIFIIAVPSLAYIFLFRQIGGMVGLPKTMLITEFTRLMYVLPVVSLAMPSIASLMKWIRRYMIDQ